MMDDSILQQSGEEGGEEVFVFFIVFFVLGIVIFNMLSGRNLDRIMKSKNYYYTICISTIIKKR